MCVDDLYINQQSHTNGYNIILSPVDKLKSSEHVDIKYVDKLVEEIRNIGLWTSVIPVENSFHLIMDGNHRFLAAKQLGLNKIPVIKLCYSDKRVRVLCWNTGKPYNLNVLMNSFQSDELLPYKSTRHLFTPSLPDVNFMLSELRDNNLRTVRSVIS